MSTIHPHSEIELDAAFSTLSETLFDKPRDAQCQNCEPSPKILIVAGAQGSGKTYLLEKKLLPSGRFDNYIRLYLPSFRALHPAYAAMEDKGSLYVYEHTEAFIWALGERVFKHAFTNAYNIIMETALDDPKFAAFPPSAVDAGYQFEVHMIACQKEFSHWATLDRAVKSLEKNEFERFLRLSQIEASQLNARLILDAFENACTQVPGSQITLYHRGIETAMESKPLCHSHCEVATELSPQQDLDGEPFVRLPAINTSFIIQRTPQENYPCSYPQYAQVVHAGMTDSEARQQMVRLCCKTLGLAQDSVAGIPADALRALSLYVIKYIYP